MDKIEDDPAAQVELWLMQYVDSFGMKWGFPPHSVCLKICRLVFQYGTMEDFERCLIALHAQKQRPFKTYDWFAWKARDWFLDIEHERSRNRQSKA